MIRLAGVILVLWAALGGPANAEDEPLHARIDAILSAKHAGPVAGRASDAEFARRVYLDFAGRIPRLAEVRTFLADTSAEKRTQLIEKLLASDEYPRRMALAFNVMLMERRGDDAEWMKFLETSFANNKPWDEMVRAILHPDADNEQTRGAAHFIAKRLEKYGQNPTDYPGLVRDVGRMFLGVDVQCAQCHDHLFVDDYNQVDYQGLYAFLGTAILRRDTKFPAVAENPLTKKIEFASVFTQEPMQTGPRLPGGKEIAIPEFKKGEEYLTPPDRKTRAPGVLKFSPLKVLSEELPRADNTLFAKNIANRLWWLMLGRGLVEPLDLQHSDNPPTHPELLQLLADEFVAHKFDVKWMLREIALTDAYQRSSQLDGGKIAPDSYRVALQKPLSAEQLLDSLLVATGEQARVDGSDERKDLLERFRKALANPPREPETSFNPSVKGALFLMNDTTVLGWFEPREGNLVARLAKLDDGAVAEELYLSVLSRKPTETEAQDVTEYLKKHSDRRPQAVGNLAWALAASTEFAVNH